MVDDKKSEFIKNEIWILTFNGAFQHAKIYGDKSDPKKRPAFRKEIKHKVDSLVEEKYRNSEVSSTEHIETIRNLKAWIDERYFNILNDGEIRVGVVQKILNLFLKYQWCLGLVSTPPHCPFDRKIINRLKDCSSIVWTRMTLGEYKKLVNAAEEAAKGKSLAEWELEEFAKED